MTKWNKETYGFNNPIYTENAMLFSVYTPNIRKTELNVTAKWNFVNFSSLSPFFFQLDFIFLMAFPSFTPALCMCTRVLCVCVLWRYVRAHVV